MPNCVLKILENAQELREVEELQRKVWVGSETEIVPVHMLVAVIGNGGLVIGAYETKTEINELGFDILQEVPAAPHGPLIGFIFGFPGLYATPDGPRLKHHSHMLGVHPDYRNQGIGFTLKRAQWQMVRHQGLDRITWTYDPLLSYNAYLNLTRLGAVCNTYKRNEYGEMRDGLNLGLPSDRFVVDWWVNTKRVNRRLSTRPRLKLDLAHFFAAGAEIINPTHPGEGGFPRPGPARLEEIAAEERREGNDPLLLVEIPADFRALKAQDQELALEWRMHTREIFETLFERGYLATDFVHLSGSSPRSFYVLSHGESTL